MSNSRVNFIRQQGFEAVDARSCESLYTALMFQPRVVGILMVAGVLLQATPLFLTLSAVLVWSALVPAVNPFDRLYDTLVGARNAIPGVPPAPRRFAQGLGATFLLLIGLSLRQGLDTLAWVLEAFVLIAIGLVITGRFCFGSFAFHLLSGNGEFARRTLPWGRGIEGDEIGPYGKRRWATSK
jgi:Domain of unknown function (DUF4395)